MLVLRELGKNQPLVIESGKFIIVNIAGFLKFTGILDRVVYPGKRVDL